MAWSSRFVADVSVALDEERSMTKPLRSAHFFGWIALSVAALVVFVVGLSSRRPQAPNNVDIHWELLK
jgi:hypothetical protein